MRNNIDRLDYVNRDANWTLVEGTAYTRRQELLYKGDKWYRIQIKQWLYSYYSDTFHKPIYGAIWRTIDHYIIDEHDCLQPITTTDIVKHMTKLDKKYPDRASDPAIPSTLELPRKKKKEDR